MTLREQFLTASHGNAERAAARLAAGLMEGDAASFKAGYTRANALLAAAEMFPEANTARTAECLIDLIGPEAR